MQSALTREYALRTKAADHEDWDIRLGHSLRNLHVPAARPATVHGAELAAPGLDFFAVGAPFQRRLDHSSPLNGDTHARTPLALLEEPDLKRKPRNKLPGIALRPAPAAIEPLS